jgi:hypothetical protein
MKWTDVPPEAVVPPEVAVACAVPNTDIRIWASNCLSPVDMAWSRINTELFVAMIRFVNPGCDVGGKFVATN